MAEQQRDRKIDFAGKNPSTKTRRGRNHLLVIGIDQYLHVMPLQNAVRDAKSVTRILSERYSFEADDIYELYNEAATREAIISTLDFLADKLSDKDNLLIYFAGHGYYRERLKIGYWVPVDARNGHFSDFVNHSTIRDYIQAIPAHHVFMIVDSCFSGNLLRSLDRDLTPTVVHANRVDRFPSRWCLAAGMIEKVSDGYIGDHSPFAQSLITFLKVNEEARFPVQDLINHVSKATSYNADQTPIGGVILKTGDQNGQFVFDLREGLRKDMGLEAKEMVETVPSGPVEMVHVEGGSFYFGRTGEQNGRQLFISSFEISKYPVTQQLWKEIMGHNPSHFQHSDQCPVEQISYHDVQEFLSKLNERYPDFNYRLPTEAEWEFAAIGGNSSLGFTFAGSNYAQETGWYFGNSKEKTHPVGRKTANELGIFDMAGNVWEWCQNPYSPDIFDDALNLKRETEGRSFSLRGGSWGSAAESLKTQYRFNLPPNSKSKLVGFRLIRTLKS